MYAVPTADKSPKPQSRLTNDFRKTYITDICLLLENEQFIKRSTVEN